MFFVRFFGGPSDRGRNRLDTWASLKIVVSNSVSFREVGRDKPVGHRGVHVCGAVTPK